MTKTSVSTSAFLLSGTLFIADGSSIRYHGQFLEALVFYFNFDNLYSIQEPRVKESYGAQSRGEFYVSYM